MKYTTNFNLYKPDYDDTIDVDFINKNMDTLDNQLGNLDYVKNVSTSNHTLKFITSLNKTINVPLNYLPASGGNIDGTLTVNGNDLLTVVEKGPNYIKYSDGTALIFDKVGNISASSGTYTYPIPLTSIATVTTSWTGNGSGHCVVKNITATNLTLVPYVGTNLSEVKTTQFVFIVGTYK